MLRIEFKTGNAAFRNEDDELDVCAVATFLRKQADNIAHRIEFGFKDGKLMDINGNKVGSWELED